MIVMRSPVWLARRSAELEEEREVRARPTGHRGLLDENTSIAGRETGIAWTAGPLASTFKYRAPATMPAAPCLSGSRAPRAGPSPRSPGALGARSPARAFTCGGTCGGPESLAYRRSAFEA